MKKIWFILLILLAGLLKAIAPYQTVPTTTVPVIDGKLDDLIWQKVQPFSSFKTYQPDYNKDGSERTEAFMTYDARYLYIGFHCFDATPGQMKAAMSKRDNIDADDWFGIVLDTFSDSQSGYLFAINPLGIQMDGTLNADGNGDGSFDTVWQSAGRITSDGCTAEMAIPWKSLRFPFKKKLTMRIGFLRTITRKSEKLSMPGLDPEKGSVLAQLLPFELEGIKYQRPVEMLPAVTFSQNGEHSAGAFASGSGKGDFSLTGKLGITSDLTLDAAYNPDFSQVESDAGQIDVNLRYALYYPEKRPFFLEGLENFGFGAHMEANPLGAVVHTRTIVDPLMGFKLNGKIGTHDQASFIFALDEYPGDLAAEEGDGELAGRSALCAIFRYKRILKDDSYVGGFLTSRDFAGSYNRLAGADGRLRLGNTSYLEFHAFESFSRDRGAEETAAGAALGLRYVYSTRKWNLDFGYVDIGKNFRTDLGYLTRTGYRTFPLFAMYSIYPRSSFFQRIDTFYWATQSWDTTSNLFESFNLVCLRLNMSHSSMLRFDAILANEVFAGERFPRNAWRIIGYTQIFKQLYLETTVRSGRSIYYDPDAPYAGRSTSASLGVMFQPIEKLNSTLSVAYADFFRQSDGEKIYDYTILRSRNAFQFNKHLFLRAILEYNFYWKVLNADLLASFTYIPGTVIYLGYGSVFEKIRWNGMEYENGDEFLNTRRSFFFKASYLWRL